MVTSLMRQTGDTTPARAAFGGRVLSSIVVLGPAWRMNLIAFFVVQRSGSARWEVAARRAGRPARIAVHRLHEERGVGPSFKPCAKAWPRLQREPSRVDRRKLPDKRHERCIGKARLCSG